MCSPLPALKSQPVSLTFQSLWRTDRVEPRPSFLLELHPVQPLPSPALSLPGGSSTFRPEISSEHSLRRAGTGGEGLRRNPWQTGYRPTPRESPGHHPQGCVAPVRLMLEE
jgi:hypothetical protein